MQPAPPCKIRKYEPADLDSLLSSWENATRLAHPFLSEDFLSAERENIPNVYIPITDTWVAEYDSVVIGFIALLGNEVGAIFVQPDFHGQGIGPMLMDKACELQSTLEVEVFEENYIGRRFYAKYGFEPLSKKIHEDTGNALIRLRLTAKAHT